MKTTNRFLMIALAIGLVSLLAGCGKKAITNQAADPNQKTNADVVVTEAPYTMAGGTKIFNLELADGKLNYKTMTFNAGDMIEIHLSNNGQPENFRFQNIPAFSTNGVFGTKIQNDDQGGNYFLVCTEKDCGMIAVTVVPGTAGANTSPTDVNVNNQTTKIDKIELQRIPAGTTFNPANTYEATAIFKVGDQFGFNITGTFKVNDKLTYEIVDTAGKIIEPQGVSSKLITGSNGSCCFATPTKVGAYTFKAYVSGVESGTTNFSIK